jgi:hypothetical protein
MGTCDGGPAEEVCQAGPGFRDSIREGSRIASIRSGRPSREVVPDDTFATEESDIRPEAELERSHSRKKTKPSSGRNKPNREVGTKPGPVGNEAISEVGRGNEAISEVGRGNEAISDVGRGNEAIFWEDLSDSRRRDEAIGPGAGPDSRGGRRCSRDPGIDLAGLGRVRRRMATPRPRHSPDDVRGHSPWNMRSARRSRQTPKARPRCSGDVDSGLSII